MVWLKVSGGGGGCLGLMKAASPLTFKRKLHQKVVMDVTWEEDPGSPGREAVVGHTSGVPEEASVRGTLDSVAPGPAGGFTHLGEGDRSSGVL